MIDCRKLKLVKPRTLSRVISDIEYLISQGLQSDEVEEAILCDIMQVLNMLRNLSIALEDRDYPKAFKIINPPKSELI